MKIFKLQLGGTVGTQIASGITHIPTQMAPLNTEILAKAAITPETKAPELPELEFKGKALKSDINRTQLIYDTYKQEWDQMLAIDPALVFSKRGQQLLSGIKSLMSPAYATMLAENHEQWYNQAKKVEGNKAQSFYVTDSNGNYRGYKLDPATKQVTADFFTPYEFAIGLADGTIQGVTYNKDMEDRSSKRFHLDGTPDYLADAAGTVKDDALDQINAALSGIKGDEAKQTMSGFATVKLPQEFSSIPVAALFTTIGNNKITEDVVRNKLTQYLTDSYKGVIDATTKQPLTDAQIKALVAQKLSKSLPALTDNINQLNSAINGAIRFMPKETMNSIRQQATQTVGYYLNQGLLQLTTIPTWATQAQIEQITKQNNQTVANEIEKQVRLDVGEMMSKASSVAIDFSNTFSYRTPDDLNLTAKPGGGYDDVDKTDWAYNWHRGLEVVFDKLASPNSVSIGGDLEGDFTPSSRDVGKEDVIMPLSVYKGDATAVPNQFKKAPMFTYKLQNDDRIAQAAYAVGEPVPGQEFYLFGVKNEYKSDAKFMYLPPEKDGVSIVMMIDPTVPYGHTKVTKTVNGVPTVVDEYIPPTYMSAVRQKVLMSREAAATYQGTANKTANNENVADADPRLLTARPILSNDIAPGRSNQFESTRDKAHAIAGSWTHAKDKGLITALDEDDLAAYLKTNYGIYDEPVTSDNRTEKQKELYLKYAGLLQHIDDTERSVIGDNEGIDAVIVEIFTPIGHVKLGEPSLMKNVLVEEDTRFAKSAYNKLAATTQQQATVNRSAEAKKAATR